MKQKQNDNFLAYKTWKRYFEADLGVGWGIGHVFDLGVGQDVSVIQ